MLGEFDAGLNVRPNPLLGDILHYASGYAIVRSLVQSAIEAASRNVPAQARASTKLALTGRNEDSAVIEALKFVNDHRDAFEGKSLHEVVPDFTQRARQAIDHFQSVLSHDQSPHADDSAYMIGWLENEMGHRDVAIKFFAKALKTGNGDYGFGAQRRLLRMIETLSLERQRTIIASDENLRTNSALLYAMTRTAYRAFDYAKTIVLGQESLQLLGIPVDRLPVTTDPDRIAAALQAINPDHVNDRNLIELPYLIEAARDLSLTEAYIRSPPAVIGAGLHRPPTGDGGALFSAAGPTRTAQQSSRPPPDGP